MNRLTIGLLLALILSVVMGVMVALFQQRTISTLRRENARLTHAQGTGAAIPLADIPGRYRWIKEGVDSGIITLNAAPLWWEQRAKHPLAISSTAGFIKVGN